MSIGTPMKAASSPSAVSWKGSLAMVGIPDTLATNSALGGTLKRFPEDFLLGFTHTDKVCGVRREKKSAADGEMTRRVTEVKFFHSGNMSVRFNAQLSEQQRDGLLLLPSLAPSKLVIFITVLKSTREVSSF